MKHGLITRRLLVLAAGLAVILGLVSPAADARPRLADRNPVLVVGGIAADTAKLDQFQSWLTAQGLTAYTMVLLSAGIPPGPSGTAPIADSAQAIADKVTQIKQATGAARVDIVAHSEGGLAERHYAKFLGGVDQIGTYIDVGTPEFGEPAASWCAIYPGCQDMSPNSPFLNALNADPPVPAGLTAYHFFSDGEGSEKTPLPGATNASVQSYCPGRAVSHPDELTDAAMQQLINSALAGGPVTTTCP